MNLGYCPHCGALDARYTGGGNPYNQNCAEVKCNTCGYTSSLHVFRDARPPSRKKQQQEQQQEQQSLSELAFEQEIEKKKLAFEQEMLRGREEFEQEIEKKKLVYHLENERNAQRGSWDWSLLVPILGIGGMFLMLALVIICL